MLVHKPSVDHETQTVASEDLFSRGDVDLKHVADTMDPCEYLNNGILASPQSQVLDNITNTSNSPRNQSMPSTTHGDKLSNSNSSNCHDDISNEKAPIKSKVGELIKGICY